MIHIVTIGLEVEGQAFSCAQDGTRTVFTVDVAPRSSSNALVPVDVIRVQPGVRARVGEELERHRHRQIPKPASDGANGFALTDPRGIGDDAFDALPAEMLVRGERPRTSWQSRRHFASTIASSIAIEAPWPELGEVAWAASPRITIASRRHVGTTGMSYTGKAASSSAVAEIISRAGPRSSAKSASSCVFHSAGEIAPRFSRVGATSHAMFANQ